MLLSTSGLIGSGKDTFADYLVNQHNFTRMSFAATLKDVCSTIFGWDREMLEGRSKEARANRDQVDQWWADRLGMPDLSPRWVLQYFGTDVCRKHFHDDIWLACLENKLRHAGSDVVITDARFPNELDTIKRLNGNCVFIERGDLPPWFNYAKKYNDATEKQRRSMRIIAEVQPEPNIFNMRVHQSEWAWVGRKFDYEVDNNGTLDDLYKRAEQILDAVSKK